MLWIDWLLITIVGLISYGIAGEHGFFIGMLGWYVLTSLIMFVSYFILGIKGRINYNG